MELEFKSNSDKRKARVEPYCGKAYCVMFTFPSGREGLKGPFPSQRSAASWAKGYVNDPANA